MDTETKNINKTFNALSRMVVFGISISIARLRLMETHRINPIKLTTAGQPDIQQYDVRVLLHDLLGNLFESLLLHAHILKKDDRKAAFAPQSSTDAQSWSDGPIKSCDPPPPPAITLTALVSLAHPNG